MWYRAILTTSQLSRCDEWLDEPVRRKIHKDNLADTIEGLASGGTDGAGGINLGPLPMNRRVSAAAVIVVSGIPQVAITPTVSGRQTVPRAEVQAAMQYISEKR